MLFGVSRGRGGVVAYRLEPIESPRAYRIELIIYNR